MGTDTKGALAVFEGLSAKMKPLVKALTKSAVRRKKMNISSIDTANQTVTVYEAASPTNTITVPYRAESGISQMTAGQSVQVEWLYDDLSTAVAVSPGKGWTAPSETVAALGIADHVIETGTSGNFSWRKWSSGVSEMWGFYDVVNVPCTNEAGALYVTNVIYPSMAFPSGVFLSSPLPTMQLTFNSPQGTPAFVWCDEASIPTSGLITPFRLMRHSSATINGRMEYTYIGRWQ